MLNSDCPNLQLLARGKVRDLYRLDNDLLLFVATDRISAYDVIMKSGIPGKGKILTQMSAFWFSLLKEFVPNHLVTCDINKMPHAVQEYKEQLEGRVMMIKSCKILPVEAIVRGYITGSGMKEYALRGTVCDIPLPAGLKEADKLNEPLFTPSTKADLGEHDQNIHPNKLPGMIGEKYAKEIEEKAIELYTKARDYAFTKGIIIADTKFEFGIDQGGRMILADEVLTPDSSRFWSVNDYSPGSPQKSYDKQYLRDYLTAVSFNKKEGIELPQEIISATLEKYLEAFKILTGKMPVL